MLFGTERCIPVKRRMFSLPVLGLTDQLCLLFSVLAALSTRMATVAVAMGGAAGGMSRIVPRHFYALELHWAMQPNTARWGCPKCFCPAVGCMVVRTIQAGYERDS